MVELRNKVEELLNNCDNSDNIYIGKLRLIKRILEDDTCFFNMTIDVAYDILRTLEIQNVKEKYLKLVSYDKLPNKSLE